jgi:hypothetical protein
MRWLQWFGDHIGIALLLATLWFLAVTITYFVWIVVGGWDRESNLALAQALTLIGFAGFGLVLVCAAVLAFRPPRPELSCFVRDTTQIVAGPDLDQLSLRDVAARVGPTLTIVNSGPRPATDVTVEVVGGTLSMVSRYWKQTDRIPLAEPDRQAPDHPLFLTVLERSWSLPDRREEVVFQTSPTDSFRRVHITASNAATVTYEPSLDDWGDVRPE